MVAESRARACQALGLRLARLNENVSQALEGAKAIADKKGFLPDYGDFKHLGEGADDAWSKAYDEYMS